MKVLVDGKEVDVENDVKIVWEGEFLEEPEVVGEHLKSELHLTANCEGIVLDVVSDGEVEQTRSLETLDLSEMAT